MSNGPLLDALASGYATLISEIVRDTANPLSFDVLFGPAYKGIPLAAATSLLLHRDHKISTAFAFDRKEAKDHGEGGKIVGSDIKGKKVLILDDVMTAGTAVRSSIDLIRREGGEVVGVVMCLDREEIGPDGGSTQKEVDVLLGGDGSGSKVRSIVRMRDLVKWLEENGQASDVEGMKAYWDKYGIKDSP